MGDGKWNCGVGCYPSLRAGRRWSARRDVESGRSDDREVGDVAGGRAREVWADRRQDLDGVAGAHQLAAARRDARLHQKTVENYAFIAQRVAFVDADDDRRQALDVIDSSEARPGEWIAGVQGFDAVGHGASVVLDRDEDAVVLGRGWELRLGPLPGDERAHGVDAIDQIEFAGSLQLHGHGQGEITAAAFASDDDALGIDAKRGGIGVYPLQARDAVYPA